MLLNRTPEQYRMHESLGLPLQNHNELMELEKKLSLPRGERNERTSLQPYVTDNVIRLVSEHFLSSSSDLKNLQSTLRHYDSFLF